MRRQPAPAAWTPPAENLPGAGVYHLLLRLGRPVRVRVGALGTISFPAGYYTYTGRAMRGLAARLARHARQEGKRLRWHIDYLLRHADLEGAWAAPASHPAEECRRAGALLARAGRRTKGGAIPARGFGASDCRCPAHLAYWGTAPPAPRGTAWGRRLRTRRPSPESL